MAVPVDHNSAVRSKLMMTAVSASPPFDPVYMAARRVLLDALVALERHGGAVVVVGAQAVYFHTGSADLSVAPYTTDADLAVDPSLLASEPRLEVAMVGAGFGLKRNPDGAAEPGMWIASVEVNGQIESMPVDLIVPEAVAPVGRHRSARIPGHMKESARRAAGLEPALFDHAPRAIAALDPNDARSVVAEVAGPAALLVAKAYKLRDRIAAGKPDRLDDKDAADVLRLMQEIPVAVVAPRLLELMEHETAGPTTAQGRQYLGELFGRRGAAGIAMAVRALRVAMDPEAVEVICTSYIRQLDAALAEGEVE
jgi:hypothetical protein